MIENDNTGYGSHLPFLEFIFKAFDSEIERVVEFGLGMNSTLFFLKKSCILRSIEMQDIDWLEHIKKQVSKTDYMINWFPSFKIDGDLNNFSPCADLAFIDGSVESRVPCIQRMFEIEIPLIVAHDYECPVYHYELIQKPSEYFEIVFDNNGSKTVLFIHKTKLK